MQQGMIMNFDNDNNMEEKALEYYKNALEKNNHLPSAQRRIAAGKALEKQFPWVTELFEASRDDNHPEQARGRSFVSSMGNASSKIKNSKNERSKKGPSPVWAMQNWFENRDTLRASRDEIAHFSGYTHGAFDYAISKLQKDGFVFDTDKHGVTRVTARPNDQKDKLKKEMAALLEKFEQLKSELNEID
jgi:hypothetical protein